MATTQKRGDSYRITVSCGYDIHGKQIRHTMTWTPDPKMTPKQVEKELKRQTVLFEERIKNGTVEVNGKIKLKDFCDKFLDEYARTTLKPTTVRNYERDIERICEALGHLKLEAIKPAQITRFYNNLMKDGSNKATGGALDAVSVAAVNRTFSAVMGKAVKWGYINSNPVSRAEKPRVEQKESTYLDADEARHMLELIQEEPIHWRTVIIFDLFSGLRRQELLGLKWEDIDFDKRTITVRRTVNYVPKKGVYESTTKSKKSRRPLHISATAVGLLLEVQRWQQQREKELGDAWKGEGYVFTKDDGERQFPDSITAWFHKFVMRNNLPDVHVHSLRHTFASLQIADGVPLVAVSRQLGHAKPSTTSDIYAHVLAQVEAQADKTFDRFADVLNLDEDATNTKKPKKFKKNGTE